MIIIETIINNIIIEIEDSRDIISIEINDTILSTTEITIT